MSQALTVEALEELERLERLATKAPWKPQTICLEDGGNCGAGPTCEGDEYGDGSADQGDADGNLIAAARNALPQLLESARRYQSIMAAWHDGGMAEHEFLEWMQERDEEWGEQEGSKP